MHRRIPHSVTVEVEVPDSGAHGTIIAQGGAFGGWSLYAHKGRLTYCYNFLGLRRYRKPGQQVTYTLQTNGTRLDDAWCAFFKKHGFLIGLSVDGPRELHDAYRVNKGGAGTFDQVMRGEAVLKKHGVDFNQEKSMVELVASDRQRQFGKDKQETLPRYCRECPVRFACNGGCPRERFLTTPDGEPGLNYLCAGYKLFFTHVDRPMRLMAGLLERNRAPSELMRLYAQEDAKRQQEAFGEAGRNDPCPRGLPLLSTSSRG